MNLAKTIGSAAIVGNAITNEEIIEIIGIIILILGIIQEFLKNRKDKGV